MMTSAIATLPVDYKTKFDNVVEELEIDVYDYEFRRSMREQNERRSRKYLFLRLELFEYLKRYRSKYNYDDKDLVYKGKIYRTMYCRRLNDKVNNYYNIDNKKIDYQQQTDYKIRIDKSATDWYIGFNNRKRQKLISGGLAEPITELKTPLTKEEWEALLPTGSNQRYEDRYERFELKDFINRQTGGNQEWNDFRNDTNKKYDEKNGFVIKIRVVEKTLDYAGLNRRYYDATNIKHFDPTTFKTSNKGLKADTTWTYTSGDRTAGWTFGGIDAKDMERFAVKNGFKKEKNEKYVYGDYAIWILRTLV
jgi:hypothetical protein